MRTNKKHIPLTDMRSRKLDTYSVPYSAQVGNGEIMEEIEFCKADFLYMLNELNKYAVENGVKNAWITNNTLVGWIDFTHFSDSYENDNRAIFISLKHDTHESAYEKYERMMTVMKEGALL